jgi:hypothetical protein
MQMSAPTFKEQKGASPVYTRNMEYPTFGDKRTSCIRNTLRNISAITCSYKTLWIHIHEAPNASSQPAVKM